MLGHRSASPEPKSGLLHEAIAALFDGAMIPLKISFGATANFPRPTDNEVAQTIRLLGKADQIARQHAPGEPPAFDPLAALWAARVLQFACVRLVDKIEVDIDLPDDLAMAEPDATSAAQHWSVDLVFRSWWDLVKRSTAENKDDPLNTTLLNIASRWPLAAVGTTAKPSSDRLRIVWGHPSLRQIYIDRVIQRADREQAADPLVAEAIRSINGR
jgi:hypothetical protein